jgi:phenylacetate-CoA ligase
MMLAQYLKQHPEYSIRPHSIILRSEKLYPEHRRYMEEVFGCEIFEIYAQWEYVCFAADCSRHNLHHFFDLGVVEIVKDGKPCAPGEEGELVCTGLHNYSMPLIRYRIGDLGRIRNVDCPCGCRMPVIEITGCRGKDLIVTRNGYFNVMSGLPVQMQQIKPFQQIQFVQEDLDRLEVRIVKREDFTPDERERMKQTVSRYFLDQLAVSIRFVDEIPRTEAQKYKYVESKVSLKL